MVDTTSGRARSPWLRRYTERSHRHELVCFPHAGGSASAFRDWATLLPEPFGLAAVQYPSRQERITEPPAPDMAALADEVAGVLARDADGPPVALFGHSMGAVAAFEVARRLGSSRVSHLFVSAARPPAAPRESAAHLGDDTSLVAYLRSLGGAGAHLYEDPDLRALILPAVRGDLTLLARYRYRPGAPLRCPVTALVGDSDPSCTAAQADGWASHTTARFARHVMPGGHFYLESVPHDVLALVAGLLG
jgi:surfactin synthase thioesterase subunit